MTNLRLLRAAAFVAAMAAAGCGGSDDDGQSEPTASVSSTNATVSATTRAVGTTTEESDAPSTTERPTTTQAPTTTTAPQPAFSVTVPAYTQSWNDLWSQAAQISSPNSLAPLDPQPAGDQLYGSALNGELGMYLESDTSDGPVNAVVIALAPGNTSTPTRVLAAASSGLVAPDQATSTLEAFNEKVLPFLGTVTQEIKTINVTDELDFTIYVAETSPAELVYVWTPAGAAPSDEALSARYS